MTGPHRGGAPKGKPQHKLNALTLALMLDEMLEGPFTVTSLIEVTGMGKTTLYRVIRTFHAKEVIHVSDWEKDAAGRVCVPVYSFGRGKDKKRQPKDKRLVNREYVRRKRHQAAAQGLTLPIAGAVQMAANDTTRRAA